MRLVLVVATSLLLYSFAIFVPNSCLASNNKRQPLMLNIPYSLSFDESLKRKEYTKELDKLLKYNKTVVNISGSYGMGLEEFALSYLHDHLSQYDIIWWFDASQDLKRQYSDFAYFWNKAKPDGTGIEYENTVSASIWPIKERLRLTRLRWMLVFVNVKDYNDIIEYFASKPIGVGKILVLSPTKLNVGGGDIALLKFTRAQSLSVFKKHLSEVEYIKQSSTLEKIAERLDDNPKSILNAALLLKNRSTIKAENYLNVLHESRNAVYKKRNNNKKTTQKICINPMDSESENYMKTIEMNLESLKELDQEAYDLLNVMSFLDKKEIPISFIENAYRRLGFQNKFEEKLLNLQSVGITNGSERGLDLTELSQCAIISNIETKVAAKYLGIAAASLTDLLPAKLDELIPFLHEKPNLLLHLTAILENAAKLGFVNQGLSTLKLRHLEYQLAGRRNFALANKLLEEIESDLKSIKVEDEIKARILMMKSSYVSWALGEYKLSIELVNNALKLLQQHPDSTNEDYLMVYNRLAQTHLLQGEVDEAKHYSDLGLKVIEREASVGNQDAFYQTRAKIFMDLGDFKEGLAVINLALSKMTSKEIIPGDIGMYHSKIFALVKLGQIQEAKDLVSRLSEVINTYEKSEQNINIVGVLSLEGMVNLAENKPAEAYEKIGRGLAILEEKYKKPTRFKGFSYYLMGAYFLQKEDFSKAQENYLEALKNYSLNGRIMKIDLVSEIYGKLIDIALKQNDEVETKEYFAQHKSLFGAEHPRTETLAAAISRRL